MGILPLFNIVFFAYFFLFLEACFLAYFIPGYLALRKIAMPVFAKLITAVVVGMVLWGWQGAIFGYLGIRWASYFYLILTFLLWIRSVPKKNYKFPFLQKINKKQWLLITVVTIGVIMQLTTVWFTGALSANGLSFCCGNTSDALFHVSLTNQIVERFPPYQPGMYGVVVHNYHYWSNLVVADLVRVFHLPVMATQNQYANVFISLLLGLTAIAFSQSIKAKKSFTIWLVFFLYFGGDLAYLINFVFGHGFNFNMQSLEDGTKFLVNIPRAFSLDILFSGLTLIAIWIKKKDHYTGLLVALILGTLVGFKVYTGIFAMVGIVGLMAYFLYKRNARMIFPLLLAPVLSAIVYLPVNANSGGLYFTGLWIFDNYIVNKDLGLQNWELAKTIYADHHNLLRIIQYEGMFIGLYLISSFGTKLLGLIQTRKSLAAIPKEIHIFLISGLTVSLILGLFFQQSAGGANTFNFLVSVFMLSSIYTALFVSSIAEKLNKKVFIVFAIALFLLTATRVLREWREDIGRILTKPDFLIAPQELEAYTYLEKHTNKNSLILVDTKEFPKSKDTPYVSLLTDRPVYLSGMGILASHGIDFVQREQTQNIILTSKNRLQVKKFLEANKISYILLSTNTVLPTERKNPYLIKVFQNRVMKILKVK
jgi:hypothetical protein